MNDSRRDDVAARAREALKAGNSLLCYDLVVQARQAGQDSRELQYLMLLALGNAGSSEQALVLYRGLRLKAGELNEDWLALEGRLLKDLAVRAPSPARFLEAAAIYLNAYRRTGGYFSAINAATLHLLGGDTPQARQLAREVQTLLGSLTPRDEQDQFYQRVTAAEAALLLGDVERSRQCLLAADAVLIDDTHARSRSRGQLQLICAQLHLDPQLTTLLRLPPVIHGIPDESAALAAPGPRPLIFLSLLAPPELEAVERWLERGAQIFAVIAGSKSEQIDRWQTRHGASWAGRLARALVRVQEVAAVRGFAGSEDALYPAYAAAMSLGLSRLTARRLGSDWQGVPAPLPPPAADPRRRMVALVHLDFSGLQQEGDAALPELRRRLMAPLLGVLQQQARQILFRQAWGDALHLVVASASAAAELMAALRVAAAQAVPAAAAQLRIAAHYAAVFVANPEQDLAPYFGSQLSFAAHIEPMTPPGMIYVTEAFAAHLELEAPACHAADYAGEIELARGYGKYRLFSLRGNEAAP